jgi:hypothetical protein
MARKRQTAAQKRAARARRSRRGKAGFNVLQLAETYMLLNALSVGATQLSISNFLMSKEVPSGAGKVTLTELINGFNKNHGTTGLTESELVMENIKTNWMRIAGSMIAIPIGFRLGKKLARPALTRTRALLKQAGLKGTVTV